MFAGRSVYTTLFERSLPPIQWLSLVRESDTECWACCFNWGMFYCNLCNSRKPGARSAPVLPTKPWSAVVSGRMLGSAQVRACCQENRTLQERSLGYARSAPNLICRGNRGPCQVFGYAWVCSSAPVLPRTPCSQVLPYFPRAQKTVAFWGLHSGAGEPFRAHFFGIAQSGRGATISSATCSRRTPKRSQLMLALNTYSFPTIKLKLAAFLPSAAPTGEALCGAHVFEGFFGLENGPVNRTKARRRRCLIFPNPPRHRRRSVSDGVIQLRVPLVGCAGFFLQAPSSVKS